MTDSSAAPATTQPFRLMYRSHSRIAQADRKAELGALFSKARSNNKTRGICGALLVSEECFVQVLEGDESAVRKLYARITHDPRHDRVTLLDTGSIDERVFARWAMAEVADEGEPDIPLIAHLDGIAPAAGRATTVEQEAVLDVMRDAARQQLESA